jgi:hypothetical protein
MMTVSVQLDPTQVPEWIVAEMPPGYRTRLLEIERLSADLRSMDAIGRVLWETGEPLRGAVATAFGALRCDVETASGTGRTIGVKLGWPRRLVLLVSGAAGPIPKTHDDLARAFQAVQFAGADDRVVYVPGNDPAVPPAERPQPVELDALDVLERMGVVVLTTATLFALWRLSLDDQPKARKTLERLHAQDGGVFALAGR